MMQQLSSFIVLSLLLVSVAAGLAAVVVPSANEQCQIIYGTSAMFCKEHAHEICTKLVCRVSPMDMHCNNITTFAAAEGTRCLPGKICSEGKCIDQPPQPKQLNDQQQQQQQDEQQRDAAAAGASCLYGDDLILNNTIVSDALPTNQTSCSDFMIYLINNKKSPFSYCERPEFRRACCKTCQIYDSFKCRDKYPTDCAKLSNLCQSSPSIMVNNAPIKEVCQRSCGVCTDKLLKCSSRLCQNNALCLDDFLNNEHTLIGFKCQCQTGYFGQFCELKNPCEPNPCENNGTCYKKGPLSYGCICPKGFGGLNCQSSTRLSLDWYPGMYPSCGQSPCMNGGNCMTDNGGAMCSCPPLYTGRFCDQFINPCYGMQPCMNGGICQIDYYNPPHYQCQCPSGCGGHRCQITTTTAAPTTTVNPCVPNPCQNGGFCYQFGTQFQCNCLPGFYGATCTVTTTTSTTKPTTTVNGCSSSPCHNGGICYPYGMNYQCYCQIGYYGPQCDSTTTTTTTTTSTVSNPCLPNPCQNGGLCFPFGSPYQCKCPVGYYGATCQITTTTAITTPMIITSPCKPNPCQNGGICYPFGNSYQCQCPIGYFGADCSVTTPTTMAPTTVTVNPCSPSPCQNGGTCNQYGSTYYCSCKPLYTGQCCEQFMNPCYFRGYPVCQNGGVCTIDYVNYPFYSCTCLQGFMGPNCQICSTTSTTTTSTTTQNICQPNPCLNGGICYPYGTVYQCQCPLEYYGSNCQYMVTTTTPVPTTTLDPCLPNPCLNGGLCYPVGNLYQCTCPYGYSGLICQLTTGTTTMTTATTSSICAPNPCQNGGICYAYGTLYQCICPANYYGTNCEYTQSTTTISPIIVDVCKPISPCQNGGVCYSFGTFYVCNCPQGYYGQNCQYMVTTTASTPSTSSNPCYPNPCMNGATCRPSPFPYLGCRYVCLCCPGYTGTTCGRSISYGGRSPCVDREEKFCQWVRDQNYCNAIYKSYCPASCNACIKKKK